MGHWALKTIKVDSDYAKVIQSTFYLYGPGLSLVSICLIIWFQAESTGKLSFYLALWFMLLLNMYWFGRAWNALANYLGCNKKQSIQSFVLAIVYYFPVMVSFWAISGVLGKTL